MIVLGFLLLAQGCDKQSKFTPESGEHLVFIGNTFAERMQLYGYFETLLYKSFPEHRLIVRNLGWSADEPYLMPRPLNFGSLHEHLTAQKTDVIFACFGMNESFKGMDSLDAFRKRLTDFLKDLQAQRFNGKTSPKIILISPIAHEKLGGHLPDPENHNRSLKLYTETMGEIAVQLNIPFINLFEPTLSLKETVSKPLTINGIHLNNDGYRAVSNLLAKQLGFSVQAVSDSPEFYQLRQTIIEKNQLFSLSLAGGERRIHLRAA